MSRSSESEERPQFTVAELLARYGEPAPTTGRRRRRAADDTGTLDQTAAQPASQPNRTDPGEPTIRSSGPLLSPDPPVRRASPPLESTQPGLARRSWAPAVGPSALAAGRAPLTRTALPDRSSTEQIPR